MEPMPYLISPCPNGRTSAFGASMLRVCCLAATIASVIGCGGGDAVKKFGGEGTGGRKGGVDAGATGGAGGNETATGGTVGEGGVTGTGGIDDTGGGAAETGGVSGTGGTVTTGSGGAVAGTGGNGGSIVGSGGRGGTTAATGGAPATGGRVGTGGASSGGSVGTGGASSGGSGGVTSSGGAIGSGGYVSSGGVTGTGGMGTGGVTGTGGSTQTTCDSLAADYKKEVPNAKVCSTSTRAVCGVAVPTTLGCGSCTTYVDADHDATLLKIQNEWTKTGCERLVGVCLQIICLNPSGAKCSVAVGAVNGTCQDTSGITTTTTTISGE